MTEKQAGGTPRAHMQSEIAEDYSKNTSQLKVGPEIFVSLKTGSIDESYKINQTIGEGNYSLTYT